MYLSFYCKGSKRIIQGLTVRGSWRPNRTAIYWHPLLWPSALCLSRSPGLLNRRPRGPTLYWMMAFFTASYHQLVFKTPSGVPRAPSAGCGFPYHISSLTRLIWNSLGGPEGPLRRTVAFSTTSCLWLLWSPTRWLPVFTELYNNSIAHSIAHSIFGMACLIVITRK